MGETVKDILSGVMVGGGYKESLLKQLTRRCVKAEIVCRGADLESVTTPSPLKNFSCTHVICLSSQILHFTSD